MDKTETLILKVTIKQFLSKVEDIFREPYGRRTAAALGDTSGTSDNFKDIAESAEEAAKGSVSAIQVFSADLQSCLRSWQSLPARR